MCALKIAKNIWPAMPVYVILFP